jgi:hypothetical protein
MIRRINLTELVNEISSNLPCGTIVVDPRAESIVFYKYKGILIKRNSRDFNPSMLRHLVKHSLNNGLTFAIELHESDDIASFLVPGVVDPLLMNRLKITAALLSSYLDSSDDSVVLQEDFRLIFIIRGNIVPLCLQPYLSSGDLIPILINQY